MWVLVWIVCVIACALSLSRYKKAGMGFLLGLFLGPLGLIISLVWRSSLSQDETNRNLQKIAQTTNPVDREERECPHCAERILRKAKVCKHCGRDVEPIADAEFVPVMPKTGYCPSCGQQGLSLKAPACTKCGIVFSGEGVFRPIPNR